MSRLAVLVCAFASLVVVGTSGATTGAFSFSVLHSFAGPEGETPAAPLVQGADGFFYGVAAHGGDFTVSPDGRGTAFRVDASGNLRTLHIFRGPEGAVPNSLIQGRDGFFYGTTTYGGGDISPLNPGNGTIFRMDAAGLVTVLHVFPYSIGGGSSEPGPIVQGADGALYGGALGGYGTSAIGGYVYRFDPVTGSFRHLHDFVGSDGAIPTGPLFQAADGFFYGTTNQGGLWNSGVIYKVDVLGHFALLHSLSPFYPGEGSEPKGGVIQASDGFFYGTTEQGGYGGEIFRMDVAGNFTVIHRFDSYFSDGGRPRSGLIDGRDGFLYGTASSGGQPVTASRYGVVYRVDKGGTVTVLHTFTGPDGRTPWAALVQGADGQLYGSTVVGGAFGLGVLFRIDRANPAAPAVVTVTKQLLPVSDNGRFDLKVAGTVVKAGAGNGSSGSLGVVPGTYRVAESAAAGTSLSNYVTSIACTVNGASGPSVNGSAQVDVTVASGDRAVCTITNKRKARITLTKHLIPSSDPGRFDLKVGGTVVKAGAGDGDRGSKLVGAGTYTVSETPAAGTSLTSYTSAVACTRNGGSGPAGSGVSLSVSVAWGDVLVCTITNQRR